MYGRSWVTLRHIRKSSGPQSSKQPKKSPAKRPQSLPAEQKKDVPAATSSKVVDSHKKEDSHKQEEETNLDDDKIVHLQATAEQKSDLEKNDEQSEFEPPPRKAMDFSTIVLQATRRSSLAPHGRRLSVAIEEDETSDRLSPTPSSAYSFSPHRRSCKTRLSITNLGLRHTFKVNTNPQEGRLDFISGEIIS
uniref:Uncharacterized protein n=1 Tax=Acrobeloides nanus TaxID=290746 RepID=A0A914DI99_9BILA